MNDEIRMSNDELPEGWTEIAFSDLNSFSSSTINPADYPNEIFELYSVPIFPTRKPELLKGSDIGSTKQAVAPDDVLICKINPRINRVWKVMPKANKRQIASSEWIALRAAGMNPDFFRAYFSSHEFREILCEDLTGVGGSLTRAQPKRVAKFRIPIAPLAEQKRIADKLEAVLGRVDACRARLDRVPALLKRFRQSVLAAAVSGKLTEGWREASAGVKESNADQINFLNERYSIPEAWEVTTLSDLSTMVTSGSRGWADYYSSTGAIFIRAQNINADQLDLEDVAHVLLPDKAEGKRAVVKRNDLLITITGANVGKSARVKIDLEEAYISQHIALVKLRDPKLAAFVELFLWAENAGRGQLNEAAYGGGKPGLNLQNIRELAIGLPPLPEQQEIVRRVEDLFAFADRIEARLATAQKTVERLTPATLGKAFRGELVPQDPNDEPASVLLQRLRTTAPVTQEKKRKPKGQKR
jgi:type I restriction enzyme S subunit